MMNLTEIKKMLQKDFNVKYLSDLEQIELVQNNEDLHIGVVKVELKVAYKSYVVGTFGVLNKNAKVDGRKVKASITYLNKIATWFVERHEVDVKIFKDSDLQEIKKVKMVELLTTQEPTQAIEKVACEVEEPQTFTQGNSLTVEVCINYKKTYKSNMNDLYLTHLDMIKVVDLSVGNIVTSLIKNNLLHDDVMAHDFSLERIHDKEYGDLLVLIYNDNEEIIYYISLPNGNSNDEGMQKLINDIKLYIPTIKHSQKMNGNDFLFILKNGDRITLKQNNNIYTLSYFDKKETGYSLIDKTNITKNNMDIMPFCECINKEVENKQL